VYVLLQHIDKFWLKKADKITSGERLEDTGKLEATGQAVEK